MVIQENYEGNKTTMIGIPNIIFIQNILVQFIEQYLLKLT